MFAQLDLLQTDYLCSFSVLFCFFVLNCFKDVTNCCALQGLHPRIITEGFEAAKEKALAVLEEVKVTKEMNRETLINVARTSLRTKVHTELADLLTEVRL